jgi:hypothetical protein
MPATADTTSLATRPIGPAVNDLPPASWDEFIEREAGDGPLSRLAKILGFSESTLRGQVRDQRSPDVNMILILCRSWPERIRQRFADMFIHAELARHRGQNLDFNRDGVENLEDAFDAAMAACEKSQAALHQLRELCRHPERPHEGTSQFQELIALLRDNRTVLDQAIAIAQREQLRRTTVAPL